MNPEELKSYEPSWKGIPLPGTRLVPQSGQGSPSVGQEGGQGFGMEDLQMSDVPEPQLYPEDEPVASGFVHPWAVSINENGDAVVGPGKLLFCRNFELMLAMDCLTFVGDTLEIGANGYIYATTSASLEEVITSTVDLGGLTGSATPSGDDVDIDDANLNLVEQNAYPTSPITLEWQTSKIDRAALEDMSGYGAKFWALVAIVSDGTINQVLTHNPIMNHPTVVPNLDTSP